MVAILVVLALARPATIAANDFGFSEYTYGTNICTQIKDPLNPFYQYDLATSVAKTENVLNRDRDLGTDQWFAEVSTCDRVDRKRASSLDWPRNHTRLEWSNINAGITASPMHRDVYVGYPCWDVASSFNSARDAATSIYQANGCFVPYTYTGNNSSIKQCDGRWVGGDGYYARVYQ
ncbi:MAG: hypothetical protein ACLGIJ_13475 [Candidatus Limnocylindria bacterium]